MIPVAAIEQSPPRVTTIFSEYHSHSGPGSGSSRKQPPAPISRLASNSFRLRRLKLTANPKIGAPSASLEPYLSKWVPGTTQTLRLTLITCPVM